MKCLSVLLGWVLSFSVSIAVPEGWDTDVSQMMFVDVREGTARVWTEVEDDRLYLIACAVPHPLAG